jgi:hypothetical protein
MPDRYARQDLEKEWVHSHEEDKRGQRVYRLSTYPFPRSRGRSHMTLKSNGVAEIGFPGRDDRGAHADWTWSLDGDRLMLTRPDGSSQTLTIDSLDSESLVVRDE